MRLQEALGHARVGSAIGRRHWPATDVVKLRADVHDNEFRLGLVRPLADGEGYTPSLGDIAADDWIVI